MMKLSNALIRFNKKADGADFLSEDRSSIEKDVNICSTRRYSHSMSKVYEKIDL